ncbi:type III-B CRISPR module RAMP protein Cmr4 [Pelagibius sp. Alg239-R121]|uniref:type III-B CRISPR module RAMP protein Cmr4 n=1 Tax=Pelagibius sp. Alg239-R121 TaxID=2993448 RepID=UPI0024A77159|nr:type III-B CRISPR module RAMP protein Cmr4 [Pelagibius sp. Alg239-R121]
MNEAQETRDEEKASSPFIVVGMLAETFIHAGVGQSQGAVDLPVSREATTRYPYIAGSSFKGALRDAATSQWCEKDSEDPRVSRMFGGKASEGAGELIISDVRLALLPVRSLNSAYRWVTCPAILNRIRRDHSRAGEKCFQEVPKVSPGVAILPNGKEEHLARLYLEEQAFDFVEDVDCGEIIETLGTLLFENSGVGGLSEKLAILHDDDFQSFAEYGLSVQARNKLTDKKTVDRGALWYEETLPPDTLMYSLIGRRSSAKNGEDPVTHFRSLVKDTRAYLQIGGNETVGQGWFKLTVPGVESS